MVEGGAPYLCPPGDYPQYAREPSDIDGETYPSMHEAELNALILSVDEFCQSRALREFDVSAIRRSGGFGGLEHGSWYHDLCVAIARADGNNHSAATAARIGDRTCRAVVERVAPRALMCD